MGHAYSVTAVKQVKLSDGTEAQLMRLRNPWGNATEWKGAWSDSSSEWRKVPEEERKAIGLTFDDDGTPLTLIEHFADSSTVCSNSYTCTVYSDNSTVRVLASAGEFWMSFADFSKWFQHLEVCSLGPDSLDSDQLQRTCLSLCPSGFGFLLVTYHN